MQFQALHPGFILPTRGSEDAGAFDIYMPESGNVSGYSQKVGLGFCAAVPLNKVALVLPRSGVGSMFGLELNNTAAVIDSDYRGEWFAFLKTKSDAPYWWKKGDRLLQFLLLPVYRPRLELVETLDTTLRGTGGLGSTGA